ncbi:MAG TPA: hypothetical protein VMY42_24425 [Thermoguttaceae bacterium]|nr:hypothetical protein [Thermoguttaceae bacterium]
MQPKTRLLVFGLLFSAANSFASFLTFYWPVHPHGSKTIADALGLFGAFAILAGLVLIPIYLFVPKYRYLAVVGVPVALLLVAGSFLGGKIGIILRMDAFEQLAARSSPLVAAIDQFVVDQGRPPNDLTELVPKYLPAVPSTGMGGYPEYEYLVGSRAEEYAGNPWALLVRAWGPGINFDEFMYFPKQNYREYLYGGGPIERIGDWGYLPE